MNTAWANSSARISTITDVRAPGNGVTYTFTYTDPNPSYVPHLSSITNSIGTGEAYSFGTQSLALYDPFFNSGYGYTYILTGATITNTGGTYQFTYDSINGAYGSGSSGALIQAQLPYNGYIQWSYANFGYAGYSGSGNTYQSGVRKQPEVASRSLSTVSGAYTFTHETQDNRFTIHAWTTLDDPGGVGEKYWAFSQSGANETLVTDYQGRDRSTGSAVAKVDNAFTWTQDSNGNFYISSTLTTADPTQSYAVKKQTNQTLDVYGNVTQIVYYNWGNLNSAYLTENFTYLNSSAYTSRYIFNRMTSSPTTTVTYDQYSLASVSPTPPQWDTSMQNVTARGNPTYITSPSGVTGIGHDVTGTPNSITVNGVNSQVTTSTSSNWAAPSQLTVGSLSQTMTYNTFLGLTNSTGPNGAGVSIGYDAMARPTSVTSPFGAVTTTTYNDTASPPTVITSVNGRWTQQTLDGFGRTILTTTGYGSGGGTTVSQAETVYAPCGCSPLGKMTQQAVPHAPGTSPAYTKYTYDGLGRTITMVAPDGVSTTTYSYWGNDVTVYDPAGNWKIFGTDALGNLTAVSEPNPAGGYWTTTYAYDILGHVTIVSMPRPTGTQTRSFTYSGNYLTSATNPENGTVNYTYNSYYKVATRTDAKNQQVQYTYDSYARLTQVQRGTVSNGQFTANSCQQENYYYDSNPFNANYSQYALGRLTAVQYYGGQSGNSGPGSCDTTFQELYSYGIAGGVTGKQLQLTRTFPIFNGSAPATAALSATFGYDTEGRMISEQYPLSGPNMAFTYDSMGRPYSAVDQNNYNYGVTSATYGAAGQLLSMGGWQYGGESFTYNSMLQLTGITGPTINIQYNYSATQNNGKIISQVDMISGEQVNFTYDALNRLATAQTSSNPSVTQWGQSFTYDGFGNLTNVNVIAGSAPTYSASYNPATNQQYSDCADLNGNLNSTAGSGCTGGNSYDIENRLVSPPGPVWGAGGSSETWYYYGYAPGNKRVWRGSWQEQIYNCQPGGVGCEYSWSRPTDIVAFYAPNGQKLAEYSLSYYYGSDVDCEPENPVFYAIQNGTYYYFGGRMIKNENGWVYPDRLGSIGKFYPYGTERPSATTNGTEKFTGYFRDAETGNDYAVNRYESPGQGRFMSPDSMVGKPSNPGSWNKYEYAGGDPINAYDPSGLYAQCPPGSYPDSSGFGCETQPSIPTGIISGGTPNPYQYQLEFDCIWYGIGCPFGFPTAQPQGQGGNLQLTVTNLSKSGAQENAIYNDLSFIEAAFQAGIDPQCQNWLGSSGGVVGIISGLLGTTGNPVDSYVAHGNFSNPLVNAFTGIGGTNVPAGYAAIVVNNNGAFFSSGQSTGNGQITGGTFEAQVFILLHELGHLTGAAGFQSDFNNQAAGTANNNLVFQNCSSLLKWASQ